MEARRVQLRRQYVVHRDLTMTLLQLVDTTSDTRRSIISDICLTHCMKLWHLLQETCKLVCTFNPASAKRTRPGRLVRCWFQFRRRHTKGVRSHDINSRWPKGFTERIQLINKCTSCMSMRAGHINLALVWAWGYGECPSMVVLKLLIDKSSFHQRQAPLVSSGLLVFQSSAYLLFR